MTSDNSATTMDLSSLFDDAIFKIPDYQRSYAWEERQIQDLLGDIDFLYQQETDQQDTDEELKHYFGSISIEKVDTKSTRINDWEVFNLIDGQQRITTSILIISAIVDRLNTLEDIVPEGAEDIPERPEVLAENLGNKYIEHKTSGNALEPDKFEPSQLVDEAYESIVKNQNSEQAYKKETSIVAVRRFAEAKTLTERWLMLKRPDTPDSTEEINVGEYAPPSLDNLSSQSAKDYFIHLCDIINILQSRFSVTCYTIGDYEEAGRLFEVLNDRGKHLTSAEKIKNYLLYCASHIEELNGEEISRKFNEGVENVTKYGNGDEELEQFINAHWIIFTGETFAKRGNGDEPSEIHRRIKEIQRFAPIQNVGMEDGLSESEIKSWIDAYVDSLNKLSKYYSHITTDNPLKHMSNIDSDTKRFMRNRLTSLRNSGATLRNFTPILTVARWNFGIDDKFLHLLEASEKLSMRVYQIVNDSRSAGRGKLWREAYYMYWASKEADPSDIFNDTPVSISEENQYDTDTSAYENAIERIHNIDSDKCSDKDVKQFLSQDDVISGTNTRDWSGVESKSTLRYIFYEYERTSRSEEPQTSKEQLPTYPDWDENLDLEHIKPETPESSSEKFQNHEDNVHRIGNLAILEQFDNRSKYRNSEFKTKYNQLYSDSKLNILANLVEFGEPDEWQLSDLQKREEKMLDDFVLSRWCSPDKEFEELDSLSKSI